MIERLNEEGADAEEDLCLRRRATRAGEELNYCTACSSGRLADGKSNEVRRLHEHLRRHFLRCEGIDLIDASHYAQRKT